MSRFTRFVGPRALILVATLGLPSLGWSQDAWIRKEADLLAEPNTNANIVTHLLPENSAKILRRKGIWLEIRVDRIVGWVKLSAVRFGKSAKFKTSLANLRTGREGSDNNVAATGVRGLEAETLSLAEADYDAFARFIEIDRNADLIKEFRKIKASRVIDNVAFSIASQPKVPRSAKSPTHQKLRSKLSTEIDDDF